MKRHFIAPPSDALDPGLYQPLKIEPLMPDFGAMIGGLDLSKELSDDIKAKLKKAFFQFGIIFLRGQPCLTPERHLELARIFGDPDAGSYMTEKLRDNVDILITDEKRPPVANTWHSDNTALQTPSLGTFIQIQECPPVGGNTAWSCASKAYDSLSPNMKQYLENLIGMHYWDNRGHRDPSYLSKWDSDEYIEKVRRYPPVEHPIVLTHPVTRRKAIYANETYTKHIKGLHKYEARHMLSFLSDWIRLPEFCLFHKWQQNDIAIWDNFAMQHYALADYDAHRVNQRVTFAAPADVFVPLDTGTHSSSLSAA